MIGDRQQQARFHTDFYRDYYHKILRGLILSSIVILLLIFAIIYLILFHPATPYFASTLGGQIMPMLPIGTH